MKKHIVTAGLAVLVTLFVVVLAGIYRFNFTNDDIYLESGSKIDSKDGTYIINGQAVTLKNGRAEAATPDLSAKIVTMYFGNDVTGDFNNDGFQDKAFILTQTTGGTGTLFYVAASLGTANGTMETNAILLGDRIAPQSSGYKDGEIIVNYADRLPDEPMTTKPSVGISRYFTIRNNQLVESPISYSNTQYGFSFTLPTSWRGFRLITDNWQGHLISSPATKLTGPEIIIRHPLWTTSTPRQDIPIYIFSLEEWDQVKNDLVSLGAAPIAPSELGRNNKYVFAIPARYNYAFPTGWEEVEQILQNKPVRTW